MVLYIINSLLVTFFTNYKIIDEANLSILYLYLNICDKIRIRIQIKMW
jgi:hypothetical protein